MPAKKTKSTKKAKTAKKAKAAKKPVKATATKPAKKTAKTAARKSAKKTAAKKVLKKAAAAKAGVKKPAAKKSPAKKAAAKMPAVKKPAAKKPAPKKAAAKKVAAKPVALIPQTKPQWPPLVEAVLQQLDDGKAENVVAIDVSRKSSVADVMVVASGRSDRHVNAIADQVVDRLSRLGQKNIRVEGVPQCDWVLVDAGDLMVHIFRPEVRSFYNLEKLWSDNAPQ